MAGGYSPVSTNDANVLKAFALAEAAVKNASTTPVANVTLDSAESQVVAGTNYKLVMTATGPNGADPMKWMAVVYSPLSGPMNVTSVDALALMPPMAPSMAPSMAPGPEMMAGGYSPADITAANVQKAFDTAKAQLIKDELNGDTKANVTLVKAEQQVVAGVS